MFHQKAVALLFLAVSISNCLDPCTNHTLLNDDGSRSVQNGPGSDKCDRYLTDNWYKVMFNDCSPLMPTTPVGPQKCGAIYPIWLKGEYPRIIDGVVNVTACVSTFIDDCEFEFQIYVVNCSTFVAFYLVHTDGCPERYCFDHSRCLSNDTTESYNSSATKDNSHSERCTCVDHNKTVTDSPPIGGQNEDKVPLVDSDGGCKNGQSANVGIYVTVAVGSGVLAAIITSLVWFACLHYRKKKCSKKDVKDDYADLSGPSVKNDYTELGTVL